MKVRSGFVSNSSSSSFVMLVKKDHFDKVVSGLHPYLQAVAKSLWWETKALGIPVMAFAELTVMDSSSLEYEKVDVDDALREQYEVDTESDGSVYDVYYVIQKALEKDAPDDAVFSAGMDG